jgi:hypothetical protein
MKRTLQITKENNKYGKECDGCGNDINQRDEYLTGIESCCGVSVNGCSRSLCMNCVDWITDLRNQQRIRDAKEQRRKHYEKILDSGGRVSG